MASLEPTAAPIEWTTSEKSLNGSSNVTCEPDILLLRRPLFAYLYVHVFAAVIFVGVPCNALSFFVLLRDRAASTTRVFLLALAASDNLILLVYFCWYPLRSLYDLTNWPPLQPLAAYADPYLYALSNIAKFIQVWLVVTISADRFYGVRFPLSASRVCTPRRARTVSLVLPPVSLVLNLPRFFLYTREAIENHCTGRLQFKFHLLDVLPKWFQFVYFDVFDPLSYFLIPLLLLVFLNSALIQSLRAAAQKRRAMTRRRRHSGNSNGHHQSAAGGSNDNSVTLTLIAVVSTFILFECPTALLYIIQLVCNLFGWEDSFHELWEEETGVAVSTLLILLNSSTNFFLYVLIGNKFRTQLLELLCARCLHKKRAAFVNTRYNHSMYYSPRSPCRIASAAFSYSRPVSTNSSYSGDLHSSRRLNVGPRELGNPPPPSIPEKHPEEEEEEEEEMVAAEALFLQPLQVCCELLADCADSIGTLRTDQTLDQNQNQLDQQQDQRDPSLPPNISPDQLKALSKITSPTRDQHANGTILLPINEQNTQSESSTDNNLPHSSDVDNEREYTLKVISI